ncbi:CDP-alcohol phosphatidyltransferase family protein [Zhengella sp. ZM62]|uniref:CDP-alcohol phosphatidyltransferase family protein n=1 Tax=Zhengella sedimenti TaxID=3390035 RepID=UPI003974AA3E
MLDGWVRRRIDPGLRAMARRIAAAGMSANQVTWAGWLVGMAAAAAIASGWLWTGLVLLLASRLADGLDGAVAAINGKTGYGGYLDIVLDFIFYGAIPLAFAALDPQANALAAAALLFSFYANGASFLAYAVLAERHAMETVARGDKSIYFTTGLAEATETIAVFAAMCLFPSWFAVIAWGFAAVCLYTAAMRILLARRTFAGRG